MGKGYRPEQCVDGELVENTAAQPGSALADQDLLGNSFVASQLAGAGSGEESSELLDDEGDRDLRTEARDALEKWELAAWTVVQGACDWAHFNWVGYLALATSDPTLSWSEPYGVTVTKNTIGNAVGEVAVSGLEAGLKAGVGGAVGAAVGSLSVPGVGSLVGFALGCVVEEAVGVMVGGLESARGPDQAATHAKLQMARAILSRALADIEERKGIQGTVTRIKDDAIAAIQKGTLDSALPDVIGRVRSETEGLATPNLCDFSLCDAMLMEWAKERAGRPDAGGSDVSATDWSATVEIASDTSSKDEITGEPALFAFQSRHAWSRAGLDASPAEEFLRDVREAHPVAPGPSYQEEWAAFVAKQYDGRRFAWSVADRPDDPVSFVYESAGVRESGPSGSARRDELAELVAAGDFDLSCELSLAGDARSPYVREWRYDLRLAGGDPRFAGDIPFVVQP